MAITTLVANLKDTGGAPEGAQAFWELYDGLEQKPGFAFLAEACKEADVLDPEFAAGAVLRGLKLYSEPYQDSADIKDRHRWLAFAAGSQVVGAEVLHLGSRRERVRNIGRTAIRVRMRDEETSSEIDMFGAHLSDRSAELNEAQAIALLEQVDPERSTAFALQTNAMRPWGLWQPVLRLAGSIFSRKSQAAPGMPVPESLLSVEGRKWVPKRIASLAARLGGMAEGLSYSAIEAEGFKSDSPIRQRATVHIFGVPIGKVDHIWVRSAKVTTHAPLKNPLTPTTRGLRQVPHRVVIGDVSATA